MQNVEYRSPMQELMIRDLVRITAIGLTIPVVSLLHVKRLKKAAGRPQDLADIEALEALEKGKDN